MIASNSYCLYIVYFSKVILQGSKLLTCKEILESRWL